MGIDHYLALTVKVNICHRVPDLISTNWRGVTNKAIVAVTTTSYWCVWLEEDCRSLLLTHPLLV